MVNLLENAATHTPPGTHVRVIVARSDSAVDLRIEDDGPGLPGPMAERLFEKFEHGRPEGATPSSGLGLAICRAIAQLHDMRIVGQNRAEGGARFVISMARIQNGTPRVEGE